ncbi:hypothetical protein L6452_08958 [Arctium lappa]|uniref:Uncharacterized protein n=1 Tax=Arctium lappa TaxID=4217 RepID=A0ACB9DIQ2_ARCLA|nr:hypothetical protein L6452_08958 [Arctium lappa]
MVVLATSACLQEKWDCNWLSQWSPREPCNVVHFWLWGYAVYLGWGWINIGWWLIFGDEVVERDHDCSE